MNTPNKVGFARLVTYFPQRVQALVIATLDLAFFILDAVGVDVSIGFVAVLNAFVLSLLVMLYGEKTASSNAAVKDWLDAAEAE